MYRWMSWSITSTSPDEAVASMVSASAMIDTFTTTFAPASSCRSCASPWAPAPLVVTTCAATRASGRSAAASASRPPLLAAASVTSSSEMPESLRITVNPLPKSSSVGSR